MPGHGTAPAIMVNQSLFFIEARPHALTVISIAVSPAEWESSFNPPTTHGGGLPAGLPPGPVPGPDPELGRDR